MPAYHITLAYDTKGTDPIGTVVLYLLNAEAQGLHRVLNTTLDFELIAEDENELLWVLNRISEMIEPLAYMRIYQYQANAGNGRNDMNAQIIELIQMHNNAGTVRSFRNQYRRP